MSSKLILILECNIFHCVCASSLPLGHCNSDYQILLFRLISKLCHSDWFYWSHSMSRSPFLPPAPLLWKTSVLGFHSMSLPQPLQWGLLRCHTPSPMISCSGCPIFCSALLALPVPAVPQMRETLAVTLNFVTGLSAVSTARIFFFPFLSFGACLQSWSNPGIFWMKLMGCQVSVIFLVVALQSICQKWVSSPLSFLCAYTTWCCPSLNLPQNSKWCLMHHC